ncbi:hypothetical protein SDC9_147269 [bioreactor metagenome]|uniref:Uncharacterized protein n=1 Tax=bioreactor metagenome TaxID=1076179 RepID=A0A645EDE9_9ZZZZ
MQIGHDDDDVGHDGQADDRQTDVQSDAVAFWCLFKDEQQDVGDEQRGHHGIDEEVDGIDCDIDP